MSKNVNLQKELKITKSEMNLLIVITSLDTLYSLLCKWILRITDTYVYPQNEHAYELFYIYLIDLLSKIESTGKNLLENLMDVKNIIPIDNYDLSKKIINFNKYLNERHKCKIYLAEFNLKLKIDISIYEMIYFIGNQNKHHPLRLRITFEKIQRNNPKLSKHLILLCIDSFTEHIKHNWMQAQFPIIVEHLVNIYNSLCSSLSDECKKYYVKDGDIKHHDTKPEYIKPEDESELFWYIMDKVREFKSIKLHLNDTIRKLRPQ